MAEVDTLGLLRSTSRRIDELQEQLRLERMHRNGLIRRCINVEGLTERETAAAASVSPPRAHQIAVSAR